MLTYKEAFDKLTVAYIANKVDPYVSCACFVGNLLDDGAWGDCRTYSSFLDRMVRIDDLKLLKSATSFIEERGPYTVDEIIDMENLFINTYAFANRSGDKESAIFEAFEKTLDLLREIHISKGEIIDEVPVFAKRELV